MISQQSGHVDELMVSPENGHKAVMDFWKGNPLNLTLIQVDNLIDSMVVNQGHLLF